jgi:hypothetical protein
MAAQHRGQQPELDRSGPDGLQPHCRAHRDHPGAGQPLRRSLGVLGHHVLLVPAGWAAAGAMYWVALRSFDGRLGRMRETSHGVRAIEPPCLVPVGAGCPDEEQ